MTVLMLLWAIFPQVHILTDHGDARTDASVVISAVASGAVAAAADEHKHDDCALCQFLMATRAGQAVEPPALSELPPLLLIGVLPVTQEFLPALHQDLSGSARGPPGV